MEDSRVIPQQPLDKTIPRDETDFGNEGFDSAPIKEGRLSGLNEKVFALMRPKRKPGVFRVPPTNVRPMMRPEEGIEAIPNCDIPKGYEVQNGLLVKKKTLAERVRDQIRFPILKSTPSMVSGFALVVFAVGAYLLYSALPTRPDLVLGIILVSLAGNVIINNR
jgi:hypothetical protein